MSDFVYESDVWGRLRRAVLSGRLKPTQGERDSVGHRQRNKLKVDPQNRHLLGMNRVSFCIGSSILYLVTTMVPLENAFAF